QHRRMPSAEMLARFLAGRGIERLEPSSIADSLAVRGIRREQTVLAVLVRGLLERASFEMHASAQLRALAVLDGCPHRACVGVIASEDEPIAGARLAPRTRLIDEPAPELTIVAAPADEAEMTAQRSRRDVECHESGLDHQSTGAAHR